LDKEKQIVSSQAVKFSIINYLGAAIGIISTLFIYPKNSEFLGTLRYIFDAAQIIMAFCVFGSSQALIHFFPRFKAKLEERNIFFTGILLIVLANCIIVSTVLLLFSSLFSEALVDYPAFNFIGYSIVIAVLISFVDVFKRHATHFKRIAAPTLFERFLPKFLMPSIFLLLFANIISVNQGKLLYVLIYVFIFILIVSYVIKISNVKLNFNYKEIFNTAFRIEYFSYSLFTFITIFGSFLAFKIDGLMVPNLLSLKENGVYSIGVILASTLAIPSAGIYALFSPIISDYLDNQNIEALEEKYKEISKILLIISGLLFSCIFVGIYDLFSLLPTKAVLFQAIPIILILGVNVVVDMSSGFNSHIILYSKYYRFNMVAILILAVGNILLNIFFISYLQLGIAGAAYATIISMTLYNLVKIIFIKNKFNIHPFTKIHLWVLLLFMFVAGALYFLPAVNNILLNLILKVSLCLAINGYVIYKMNWVPVASEWINKRLH